VKEKLALVIAALLITSTAFAMSTTTVTAPSTLSVSSGITLDEPDPARARADTRVLIKVTVTNDSATDNIDNVRIYAYTTFTQAIGGADAENYLTQAADNLENAVDPLRNAGENLKLAEENKKAAGPKLSAAAVDQDLAAGWLLLDSSDNVRNAGGQLRSSATQLGNAGENLSENIENWTYISSALSTAGSLMSSAGTYLKENNILDDDNILENAGFLLDNAGTFISSAATAIGDGSLRRAGENLKWAAENMTDAGENLNAATSGTAQDNAGDALRAAATDLDAAGDYLVAAADADNNAGQNLVSAAAYLTSVGALLELADSIDLKAASDNIENAADNIDGAGNNLIDVTDNVQMAGEHLFNAATYLAGAATELGAALGGDELADAMAHENAAGENLRYVENVDLTTAGDELIAAASDLSAAATALADAAENIEPTTWTMSAGADYVQFTVIEDNVIAPAGSETFGFLWTTPNISTEENYKLSVLTQKEETSDTTWENEGTLSLTVDGKDPTLAIVVTQTGVVDRDGTAVENVVGTTFDNALATITITASEELQSMGTVTVMDNLTGENLLPPITIGINGVLENTATFTVENWDDNTMIIRVASVKDLVGNEVLTGLEGAFTVDTRAPIFADNGLDGLKAAMVRTNVSQAGTGTLFNYVDNNADQNMAIVVVDNVPNADNDVWVISVTIDTTDAVPDPTIDNRWFKTITMDEGLTSILTVTATDRTGNWVSDNIENIFIDTEVPTFTFDKITKIVGGVETEIDFSSGVRINDNTPKIKVTARDSGYTSTGTPPALGVARDNLIVRLDNDDNYVNGTPFWTLENKDPWETQAQIAAGVFENVIENTLGGGLLDGTYYIWVIASDNLTHDGKENENASRSFIIDTAKPSVGDTTFDITAYVATTSVDPYKQRTTALHISGVVSAAEMGGTINIYVSASPALVTTADTDLIAGVWSADITLTEGTTQKVEVSLTDLAGNESLKKLYGYFLADATAPVVTLDTLPTTTDKTSIAVSGSVTKDTWESYTDITVTVQIGLTKQTVPVLSDGTWSFNVSLREGPNTIAVWATDPLDNPSDVQSASIERTVTQWATYAIILVIIALVLAAIAIFRKR